MCTVWPPTQSKYKTFPSLCTNSFMALCSQCSPPTSVGNHWFAFCHQRLFSAVAEFHVHGIIQYMLFITWFLSLSKIFFRCIILYISVVHCFLLLNSMNKLQFLKFICWWTSGLFPVWYCSPHYCEHSSYIYMPSHPYQFLYGIYLEWLRVLQSWINNAKLLPKCYTPAVSESHWSHPQPHSVLAVPQFCSLVGV